jgi:GDP-mannose transporter
MSNKKNEDIEMRAASGDLEGERDPFLGKNSPTARRQEPTTAALGKLDSSPQASIIAYCLSSISMTVVNKYVVSGSDWNLMFFYLAIQVCADRNALIPPPQVDRFDGAHQTLTF